MMKKMTIVTGAILLALLSAPARAHDNSVCDYQLNYDLTIQDSAITFATNAGKEIIIDRDNRLYVNAVRQTLSTEQQQLVDDYADGVRDLIPEVTSIALEGVSLGVEAATLALGTLLGEGDPEFQRFSRRISELAESITVQLDADNFSSKKLEQTFDEDFEAEIEAVVEEAVTELTPRLMAKMVTAAMSGGEEGVSSLEARAETLEAEIENFIEPRAKALEARADELCASVSQLDALEVKMIKNGLETMDLIDKQQAGREQGSAKKRFKFDFSE